MERKKYAVIVAGGRGSRMKAPIPKQFMEIEGKPILRHTVERFLSLEFPVEIIIVLPSDLKEQWKDYCNRSGFHFKHTLPSGGITRFHSVQNALEYVDDYSIVAIHDAVRPFVSKAFLQTLFSEAEKEPALIPTVPLTDSLRQKTEKGTTMMKREEYLLVQTPQIFHSELLKKAYRLPYKPEFTDDASVMEAAGYEIRTIPGEKYNIKITTPEDFSVSQAIFSSLKHRSVIPQGNNHTP